MIEINYKVQYYTCLQPPIIEYLAYYNIFKFMKLILLLSNLTLEKL